MIRWGKARDRAMAKVLPETERAAAERSNIDQSITTSTKITGA